LPVASWEVLDEGDAVRRLEMREVRPRKLAQLAFIGARAIPENNEGVRRLAPALMRQPNDRHLLHCGVSQQNTFDFDRGNVFSAADDDVFQRSRIST
jgi:hypothetical protein